MHERQAIALAIVAVAVVALGVWYIVTLVKIIFGGGRFGH